MLLKFFDFAWLKPLAVLEEAFLDYEFCAVLGKMSFTLAEIVCLLAQLTLALQPHDLIKDHSLDFDSLQRILSTSVGTSHVRRHMFSTQHVIAGFITAANGVPQYIEADTARE